jgi:flagellar basal body-associated protein FliL
MSILKFILIFFLVLIAISAVRLFIVLFRFSRFMRKARGDHSRKPAEKKPGSKTTYSKDENLINIGKDDYHVE